MSQQLALQVLQSMRCGVIAVDRSGKITLFNDQAARYLRLEQPVALREDCRRTLAGSPSIAHLLLNALHQSTLPDRAELELHTENTRQILIGFSLSRILDATGVTVGSAIFFKDLTLVEEERERQAMRNRLASLGEVAAQLAHEIRNRLGGIRLFLGLARRRLNSDEEGRTYIERAEAEILAANDKMGEILDYVRPVRLEPHPVAIEPLCRETLDATLARFSEAAIEVQWEVAADLPAMAVDAAGMRDALANLFANAVEAMGPQGHLSVRLRTEQATVLTSAPANGLPGLRGYGETPSRRLCIEIQDNGPGIAPEVRRRMFHPFFTTKDYGSGLGVPTAQKIIDAHAGALDVVAAEGGGTTVIVHLPIPAQEH